MIAPRRTIAAVSLVAVGVLAGCGSSGGGTSTSAPAAGSTPAGSTAAPSSSAHLSAAAELARAKTALGQAKSVHVAGSVASSGTPTQVDLGFTSNGTSGSVTVAGAKVDVIVGGQTVYFRAPDSFWRKELGSNANAVLKIVSGKWIKGPVNNPQFATFGALASKNKFVSQLFAKESAATVSSAPDKTIDGVDCAGIKGKDGILYVAKSDGRPKEIDPLPGSGNSGHLTFDQYDSVTAPSPPPASQTIDISKILH